MDEKILPAEVEGEEEEQRFAEDFSRSEAENETWPESWAQEENEESSEAAAESFTLRHLGQDYELDREETLELAQKGMDYDRIRAERDYMKPRTAQLEALLAAFSAEAGMTPNDFLRQFKAESLMKKAEEAGGSLSFEEALSMAQVEDFDPERAEKRRRQESILNFSRNFPQLKAEDIPESVWAEFARGGDLSPLYAMEENRQLKARLQELETREHNRLRSTLSRRSAGSSAQGGLEELWNNGD